MTSLTFDQRFPASFSSSFEVVSFKMAGVTKITFVVRGSNSEYLYLSMSAENRKVGTKPSRRDATWAQ